MGLGLAGGDGDERHGVIAADVNAGAIRFPLFRQRQPMGKRQQASMDIPERPQPTGSLPRAFH